MEHSCEQTGCKGTMLSFGRSVWICTTCGYRIIYENRNHNPKKVYKDVVEVVDEREKNE